VSGGSGDLSAVAQNILPSTDIAYDLGSASKRWRDLYLSGSTINLGGAVITSDPTSGAIALVPKPTVSNPNPSGIVISPSGGVSSVVSTGGVVSNQSFTESVQATGTLSQLVLATAQTATGTAINFTDIPSWVKRVTVTAFGLSTNGASSVACRIGGAGGMKTTGYFSGLVFPTVAWTSAVGFTTNGLYVCASSASKITYGSATLTRIVDNKWTWSGSFARDDTTDVMNIVSGGVDLGEQLTRLQITTLGGTDIFDAGTVNILYE
jgi:hypothetical protein